MTSIYQVTAMEHLDILTFDAIIKIRNDKKTAELKQHLHFNTKGLQIIKQKAIRGKIIDTY